MVIVSLVSLATQPPAPFSETAPLTAASGEVLPCLVLLSTPDRGCAVKETELVHMDPIPRGVCFLTRDFRRPDTRNDQKTRAREYNSLLKWQVGMYWGVTAGVVERQEKLGGKTSVALSLSF